MRTTVKEGQCLADVALAVCGSIEGVWALALRNDLSVTADLECEQVIEYEPEDIEDTRIAGIYTTEGIAPAGAISDDDLKRLTMRFIDLKPVIGEIITPLPVIPQITKVSVHSGEFTVQFA